MPKKRGRPTKKETLTYTATIKVLKVLYTAVGESKDDAITNLKVPRGLGVSVLTVSNGTKTQEKVFNAIQTARLFSASPNVRMYALKNTCARFDL